MSRLNTVKVADATGESAEVFAAIKKAAGGVANAQVTIGTNAPALLGKLLQVNQVLSHGSLSKKELEAINLVVSEVSGCEYCLAAHTYGAKKLGFTIEQTKQLRRGDFPDDPKINALIQFVRTLVTTRGTVHDAVIDAVHAAGYSDAQITEAFGAVSAILFTNMANRVADPVLEFPKVDKL
jgi:uncharacterized peroxidase-related enzyme